MRGPAQVRSWVSEEELLAWVREAADREAYQKRLAIWLTRIGVTAALVFPPYRRFEFPSRDEKLGLRA